MSAHLECVAELESSKLPFSVHNIGMHYQLTTAEYTISIWPTTQRWYSPTSRVGDIGCSSFFEHLVRLEERSAAPRVKDTAFGVTAYQHEWKVRQEQELRKAYYEYVKINPHAKYQQGLK